MVRMAIKPIEWPAYRYGLNGEAEIFERIEDVPDGWSKYPDPEYIPPGTPEPLDQEFLRDALKAHGIKINPQWPNAKMKEILDDLEK